MRNKIARKGLVNIQTLLDGQTFYGGTEIVINGMKRKIPAHVERLYYYIHQYSVGQKIAHSALCKVIETLAIVDKKKSICRHKSHQEFYSKTMSKPRNSIFTVEVEESLNTMLNYINTLYPESKIKTGFFNRNIPVEVEAIKNIISSSLSQTAQKNLIWENLKKVLVIANSCSKNNKFDDRKKTFFKKMCQFLVFDNPKERKTKKTVMNPSEIYRISEDEESAKIASDIAKTIQRKKTNPKMENNTIMVYEDSLVDEKDGSEPEITSVKIKT